MKLQLNKKCPRCETKMATDLAVCPSCQLNFSKFYQATNKEAKQAIKEGNKDQVLMRKGCPSDVSRVKLFLLTLFLGFTGAHYYSVGRYKMGIFFTISFLVGVVNGIITTLVKTPITGEWYQIFSLMVFVWGVVGLLWVMDIAKVCLNKFKIPVSRQK